MTDTYKGVRDFYPEDQRIQEFMFSAMRRAAHSFGYEEYNASVLEPTELYRAKSSEEIVSEQTYTFEDRGGRSVTLRPEMTPTVARMVAARKRELGYPLRWYCIQNFFRYERPQRGRLREFWQLNADLFGVPGIEADIEILSLAHRVMTELGAKESDFQIKVSSREFLNSVLDAQGVTDDERLELTRLLDKGTLTREDILEELKNADTFAYFAELQTALRARGITNVVIDPWIARGFDYYTGLVFEVFDTHPDNKRAMFGGGRYDTLVEKYGSEPVPAVGFAMGDVIARDFLETHHLLPALSPKTQLYLVPLDPGAHAAAETLRAEGVNVALGMKHEKIADHIRAAEKLGIPFVAVFGDEEAKTGELRVKHLSTGTETRLLLDKVHAFLVQS